MSKLLFTNHPQDGGNSVFQTRTTKKKTRRRRRSTEAGAWGARCCCCCCCPTELKTQVRAHRVGTTRRLMLFLPGSLHSVAWQSSFTPQQRVTRWGSDHSCCRTDRLAEAAAPLLARRDDSFQVIHSSNVQVVTSSWGGNCFVLINLMTLWAVFL